MHRSLTILPVLALSAATVFAQAPAARTTGAAKPAAAKQAAMAKKEPLVEFEMMTWPEVKAALAAGKTTAIVYTGGTEQRGPQNVNGGHTLMARATARAIALKLGNAIVMPTLASARPATSSAPPPPVFQQAPQFNNQQPADDDDDKPVTNLPPAATPQRGPVFNTFPQPQTVNPQAPQMPQPGVSGAVPQAQPPAQTAPVTSPTPTAPFGGVSVPGMVAPAPPTAPGQQPGQPVRRPGGPGGQ